MKIEKTTQYDDLINKVAIIPSTDHLTQIGLTQDEQTYLLRKLEGKSTLATINRNSHIIFVRLTKPTNNKANDLEKLRNDGFTICRKIEEEKWQQIAVIDYCKIADKTLALTEGILWGAYRFDKYKTKKEDSPKLNYIAISSDAVEQPMIDELLNIHQSVNIARDLINEIPVTQTALQLAADAEETARSHGFCCKILDKQAIESLKMGGLLSVNLGSVIPPTFTILEWKPENAVNSKPIVLVGKGLVFDTGGINLKTMSGSLDDMKCDMSGAAAVIGTFAAVSSNKLSIHLIGLIPATDNRPGFNAYVPGDVITMHSGATVEVMNTDAEGRLILADALSYAKQYDPQLVIDLATLTGSAMMTLGAYGTAGMGNADETILSNLANAGMMTGERIAWLPFWDEYDELIESEVADMKNTGGREAGAITAGKFLARYIDYPWIHLDIAGTAFLNKPIGYRTSGGTGVGVRMLYSYLKQQSTR